MSNWKKYSHEEDWHHHEKKGCKARHWHEKEKEESSDGHGCDHEHYESGEGHHKVENCVKETLLAIFHAQNKVKKEKCKTSCSRAIDELTEHKTEKPRKNTIPVILYCGCEPFKATGVYTSKCGEKLECFTSFIFKVLEVKGNCALLELLAFKNDCKTPSHCRADHSSSPCDQIECERVKSLVRTGVCITIDTDCFCAISCLPAVRL
jgi:hypothetical protein